SHIGHNTRLSPVFTVSGTETKVPDISLTRSSGGLSEVTVTAKKPMVEVRADKTILNVEGTINSTGSSALELLRKSPGVLVDKDDNLSLSGKNGVQVYVDGRPTPLSGQDLANYLKSIESSQIEAIELITNPSAKYEAAGNAGIINIRMKKNKAYGANGSVNAGYSVGYYSKYNAGASINYRNRNINIYSNVTHGNGLNRNIMDIERSLADSSFDQRGVLEFSYKNYNYKVGADYTLNKKSSLGVLVNGAYSTPEITNEGTTVIRNTTTNTTRALLRADNTAEMGRDNMNLNLNYNYNDPKGTSLVINADRGWFNLDNDQYQPNYYFTPDGQTQTHSVIYQMYSPTDITISSAKVDYEQNFLKGKLSVGGKTAFVDTDNDFQRYNVFSTGKELDKNASNRFVYKENINAGYASFLRPLKGMIIQAGVRVENTVSEGTSTGLKLNGSGYEPTLSSFRRSYTDFFPSAAITFNKNPMKTWNLTYSRRIDRPAYQDLNPFEFKLNEYTFQKGNINLRPQYTNSFGLTHTYKFRLNATLNYSHVNDIFTQLIDTIETSKSFLSKKNLATQDIVSLNITYPFSYKSYSLFGSINSNYSKYNADFGAGRKVDLDAWGLTVFLQNSLKFAKTWTAEVSAMYNAPTIYMGTFKGDAMWFMDAGLQKQIFGGKGTVKASVSDIFKTLQFRGTSDFAGQHTVASSTWESRQFRLSLNMRFGSTTVKAAKQRSGSAEDEMKRVQQGGGGIGIGN
ncbi:MAG TPA: outer membrane beta-barrel family protein, partial [Flavisolibacter sp.]